MVLRMEAGNKQWDQKNDLHQAIQQCMDTKFPRDSSFGDLRGKEKNLLTFCDSHDASCDYCNHLMGRIDGEALLLNVNK